MNRHVTNDKSQVQVIARAATILRALEEENASLSLGQIAQRVNLARSTVQRIVSALETEKLVIAATPNGRVRLGPTILRLAASVRRACAPLRRSENPFRSTAPPTARPIWRNCPIRLSRR